MPKNCLMAAAALLIALTSATSTNATDITPNQPLPERWSYSSEMVQTTPDNDVWWKKLNDPLLDSLIHTGMRNNYDVLQAMTRIKAARAQIQAAQAGYYPTIGLDASWQKGRTSGMMQPTAGKAAGSSYWNAGANMSWEIDLFGKVTAGVNQKKAAWKATKAEYAGMMVSMASEIATGYVELRVAQAQLKVAQEHISSQEHVLKIAEARHEAGLASGLDVSQAKAVYYSTIATVPSLNYQIHAHLNALATLLGIYSNELPEDVIKTGDIPDYDILIATGVPADLLRRRPDIATAEQELAQAAMAVGIAKKDFLPTLSINASISTAAHSVSDLMTKESFGYSIAPTLSWTLFSGFARRAAVAEARADMEGSIDSYNLTVMNAFTEADNAIASYHATTSSIKALNDVVEQSTLSLTRSTELYTSGNASFINVADAQLSLLSYTNQLVEAKGKAVTALINIYRTLGGGWDGEL